MNSPDKVILHCSASKDTPDGSVRFSAEDCRSYHVNVRGWYDIGYHWYITRDGVEHKGRDEGTVGAHCLGENDSSIGICYEGTRMPTLPQILTLCNRYRQIRTVYGIEWASWRPHSEYANKLCPGFPIEDLHALFKKLAV
jgi:N-acetylmuramoyl-L-alanine amidase